MQPKSGTVTFKGGTSPPLPLYERARLGIGRTYQTPVVPDELTVGETFKAARQAYRPYLHEVRRRIWRRTRRPEGRRRRARRALETLNRRKLLLACLLMRRPPLLLMDEPAAGLINSEVDEIDLLLRLLSKEMNIAIVIVEHRIELLGTIADRVMVMDAGEVISQGLIDGRPRRSEGACRLFRRRERVRIEHEFMSQDLPEIDGATAASARC